MKTKSFSNATDRFDKFYTGCQINIGRVDPKKVYQVLTAATEFFQKSDEPEAMIYLHMIRDMKHQLGINQVSITTRSVDDFERRYQWHLRELQNYTGGSTEGNYIAAKIAACRARREKVWRNGSY